MTVLRLILLGCIVLAVLTSCSSKSTQERGRVHCPACGYEFDALIEGRF